MPNQPESFEAFYQRYIAAHQHPVCQWLHVAGTTLAGLCVAGWLIGGSLWWLVCAGGFGYGLAWLGHFAFEKNQPLTFTHPWYSLRADGRLFWRMLTQNHP